MHDHAPLTPRQRLLRLAGGMACIVGGIVLFQISARVDPQNRAALVSIVLIIVGTSWIGQAARGQVESSGAKAGVAPAQTRRLAGPSVSVDRIAVGFVAAWLVPGAGHWIIGRRSKAVLYFVTVTATFVTGALLAQGRNFNYERDGVYFLAYMFNGLETLLAWATTQGLERTSTIRYYQLGFLYSAVGSLLNVVAMMDFLSLCGRTREASNPSPATGRESQTAMEDGS